MIRKVMAAIDTLRDMPHRYKVLQDARLFGVGTRSLVVKPYLIRYRINDEDLVVNVISIRHGARRPGL